MRRSATSFMNDQKVVSGRALNLCGFTQRPIFNACAETAVRCCALLLYPPQEFIILHGRGAFGGNLRNTGHCAG